LSTHFDDNLIAVEKFIQEKPISTVYFDGEKESWFVKRFLVEPSKGPVTFISEHPKSKLGVATLMHHPTVYVRFNKKFKQAQHKMDESIQLREFIAVKGLKAIGNKLTSLPILSVDLLEPDEQRENESENLLQEMLKAKRPAKIQIDRPDASIGMESEIELKKSGLTGTGKQESLF
jgi:topoisomerase-4 subunit A